jgi:hypothetical protein
MVELCRAPRRGAGGGGGTDHKIKADADDPESGEWRDTGGLLRLHLHYPFVTCILGGSKSRLVRVE